MSAPVTTPSAPTRPQVPGAPALPQVNLLPPEIRAGRQFGRVKAWLGVSLLVVVLLVSIVFVWAARSATVAEAELADTQEQNQQLLADQTEYAEVTYVLRQLTDAKDARLLGMSTEVMWRPYLSAIAATAPAGVSIDTFAVVAATPTEAPMLGTDPLQKPNVGTLTFGGRSLTLPDTAAWMDGLSSIDGFSDPWFTSAQVTEEDGSVYFEVTGSVQLTDAAYARRFVAEEEAS